MSLSGTYILILHLPINMPIRILRLDEHEYSAGFYAYVGSAFGSQSLSELLKTYLSPSHKQYRHIDYLLKAAQLEEIWFAPSVYNREIVWGELLLDIPGAIVSIDGFGPPPPELDSRLFYFDIRPDLEDFQLGARQRFPDEVILRLSKQEKKSGD